MATSNGNGTTVELFGNRNAGSNAPTFSPNYWDAAVENYDERNENE